MNVPDTFILYAVWADTTYINGLRIYQNTVVGYVRGELPADVVIPDGVTAIGWRAFYDPWECTGYDIIKTITIPASVKCIEEQAFWDCPNLEKVIIEEGQLSEIGYYAFEGCESLKSVELPDNVKTIGRYTFSDCTSLESVTMNGVERIEEGAFSCCGLTSVRLPNTIKFIGNGAFGGCDFESFTIPDSVSVENIGDSVFYRCEKLKKVVLPDGWDEIKDSMFYSCESLEDINLPSALKIIGEWAFYGCYSLKEVVIPERVTEIKNCAFYGCHSLKEVVIPEGVTEIKDHAFSECHSLKEAVIPDGVQEIGLSSFYSCQELSRVAIPSSVKTIRAQAFYNSPLSEIIIPDNATVEDRAFSVSTNLRTISIPASLLNAGGVRFWDIFSDGMFGEFGQEFKIPQLDNGLYDCRNIDIILRDGATRIPKSFLYSFNLYKFKSIKIPDGVKTIEERALDGARSDSDIELPDSVTIIEDHALAGVPVKRLPNKLEYIGKEAFRLYPGESITIPGSVKFFGEFAFYESYLKSVTIERGVTEIPGAAFAAYNGKVPGDLEAIEIPDTVTKIGPSAFFYNPNLKDVKIPDSVKVIEFDAFVGCYNLDVSVTGKWYCVNKTDEADIVDPADPSGNNLYYYHEYNWYRK